MIFFIDGCTLYAFLREEGGTKCRKETASPQIWYSAAGKWLYVILFSQNTAIQTYRHAFSFRHASRATFL